METSWVGVIGTASGAALGVAGSLFGSHLQRRWGRQDREADLDRAAKEALRTSQIESDAASFRALKPSLNALEHEWNRLGGGPGPNDEAIREPSDEFAEAGASFEKLYWQAVFLDRETEGMVTGILRCLRNFALETSLWKMWRDTAKWPGTDRSQMTTEITEHQQARKRLTGEFRSLYADLNRHMAEYVGMHRLER